MTNPERRLLRTMIALLVVSGLNAVLLVRQDRRIGGLVSRQALQLAAIEDGNRFWRFMDAKNDSLRVIGADSAKARERRLMEALKR